MPALSRFAGITIYMYYHDHEPPHLHAVYGEYEVTIGLEDGSVRGVFPYRKLSLVTRWMALHSAEIARNWHRVVAGQPLEAIPPLEE